MPPEIAYRVIILSLVGNGATRLVETDSIEIDATSRLVDRLNLAVQRSTSLFAGDVGTLLVGVDVVIVTPYLLTWRVHSLRLTAGLYE